jgi:hypothetical protein
MALLPKLKLKALVSFPSNVYGGTGIEVTKANGNFTVDLDYREFAFSGTLPPNTSVLVWDSASDNYTLVPPSATSGITDAPSDSQTYGRKNAAWAVVPGVPEAPNNGTQYARQSLGWTPVAGGGSGDVVGPASAVNNNFAAFDATTGKLIKDSGSAATSFATSGSVTTAIAASAVRFDAAQTLTAPQQTQARNNVAAAPLNSPSFTGTPIAPTVAATDNSTNLATTAFVRSLFTSSIAANGYQKLSSGLIIQWGVSAQTIAEYTVTLPIAFPTTGLMAQATCSYATAVATKAYVIHAEVAGATGFNIRKRNVDNGGSVSATTDGIPVSWLVIGY